MVEKIKFITRKGKRHVQIRIGKKTGTYIHNAKIPLDIYVQFLKRKGTKKEISLKELKDAYTGKEIPKRRLKRAQKAKRLVKTYIKKHTKIEPTIKKGINKITVIDVTNKNRTDILKAKQQLMSKLVLDKELVKLITTEENFKKIKHRIDYTIETKDNKNQVITSSFVHGKTPEEIIQMIKKAKIDNIMEEYGTVRNKLKIEGIKNTKNIQEHARVKRIDLTIVFRKN